MKALLARHRFPSSYEEIRLSRPGEFQLLEKMHAMPVFVESQPLDVDGHVDAAWTRWMYREEIV